MGFGKKTRKTYDFEFFDSNIKRKNFSKKATTPAEIDRKIKDFYYQNKKYIDKRSNPVIKAYESNRLSYDGEKTTSYELFRNKVYNSLKQGYDVQSSIKITMNSTEYAGGDVVSSRNVYKTLKEDKNTFRNLQKVIGVNEEINASSFMPKVIVYEENGVKKERKSGDTWIYRNSKGILTEVTMKYIPGVQKAIFSFARI